MKIGMSAREHTMKLMAGRSITDQCRFCEQVKSFSLSPLFQSWHFTSIQAHKIC
jgi:hypothetical protein